MVRKVIVTQADPNAGARMLQCSYAVPQTQDIRILVSKDEMGVFKLTNKERPQEMMPTFDNKNMRSWTYEYEDVPELQTAQDKRVQEVVEVFFMRNPQFLINGKPHKNERGTVIANFNIEDITIKNQRGYYDWKRNFDVMQELLSMNKHRLVDVCCFYGIEPKGLDVNDILLRLGDPVLGYAILDVNPDDGSSIFLTTWGGTDNEERDYRVTCQKALYYGIVANKMQGSGNNYYLGDVMLGTQFNDIIAYAKREDRKYQEYIVRRVKEEDTKLYGAVAEDQRDRDAYVKARTPNSEKLIVKSEKLGEHTASPTTVTINSIDHSAPNKAMLLPTETEIDEMDTAGIRILANELRAAGYGKSCTTDVLKLGGGPLKSVLRKIISEVPETESV